MQSGLAISIIMIMDKVDNREAQVTSKALTRRDFLKLLVDTVLISSPMTPLLEMMHGWKEINPYTKPIDREISLEVAQQIQDQFKLTNVAVETNSARIIKGNLRLRPASEAFNIGGVAAQLVSIYNALTQYPPEYFQTLRNVPWPWGITAGVELERKDEDGWQRIGGTVIGTPDTGLSVCLNVNGGYRGVIAGASRLALHHELWHLASNPDVTTRIIPKLNIEEQISQIDKSHGLQSDKYKAYKDASSCEGVSVPPGFAECYGEYGVSEDGATIASRLMMGDRNLWKRMDSDNILREKAQAIIEIYKALSANKMGQAFFEEMRDYKQVDWNWPNLKILE